MKLIHRLIRAILRRVVKAARLCKVRLLGISYIPPNFLFFPSFSSDSIVIDVGCSYEADFSVCMLSQYGARVYAVDPTLKHREALAALVRQYAGRLTHLPFAICVQDGTLIFHESKVNESGSIMRDHVNMVQDETISYEVMALSLMSLLKTIGAQEVDILKLDIEGAEYELLDKVRREDVRPFKQLFIEFHHHAVPRFTENDTQKLVARICGYGFASYSLDDHNYLFRRLD